MASRSDTETAPEMIERAKELSSQLFKLVQKFLLEKRCTIMDLRTASVADANACAPRVDISMTIRLQPRVL